MWDAAGTRGATWSRNGMEDGTGEEGWDVERRGLAGLRRDKVSPHSCFGLQTERNICINLSPTGSPLRRGMQGAIEGRVGRQ